MNICWCNGGELCARSFMTKYIPIIKIINNSDGFIEVFVFAALSFLVDLKSFTVCPNILNASLTHRKQNCSERACP